MEHARKSGRAEEEHTERRESSKFAMLPSLRRTPLGFGSRLYSSGSRSPSGLSATTPLGVRNGIVGRLWSSSSSPHVNKMLLYGGSKPTLMNINRCVDSMNRYGSSGVNTVRIIQQNIARLHFTRMLALAVAALALENQRRSSLATCDIGLEDNRSLLDYEKDEMSYTQRVGRALRALRRIGELRSPLSLLVIPTFPLILLTTSSVLPRSPVVPFRPCRPPHARRLRDPERRPRHQ